MNGTLIEMANWWSTERKDAPAIVAQDDQLTYSELRRWSEAIAADLIADGVKLGDRVAIFASNSMQWCALSQGVMRAGGIVAPINPRFTISEASYLLERYEPSVLYYDAAREAAARELVQGRSGIVLKELSSVSALRHAARFGQQRLIGPDTQVVIIPTSGSTARPKGVVYSHRSMLSYVSEFALAEPHAVNQPRLILFAPLCTSAGYVLLTQFLCYGGTLFVDDGFVPERALKQIVEHRITSIMGAPVFFERLAACEGFQDADFSNLRIASLGGARVSRQLLDTWIKKGVLLRQIYGQTEAGGQSTINTLEAAVTQPEKCGRGMPFTRIAIKDKEGNFCPPYTPGEIVIKGPAIMVGYWRDPEATAKTLVDGWLHTGDLGVIDDDGLLTMLDRIKDIIISGGLNISAAELERVVSEFRGIDEVAAISAMDERFGETPLVVVYSQSNIDVTRLIAHCCQHLSDYKVPRYVAVEAEPLPRLATGKIAKPALRAKYQDAHLRLTRVR